MSSAPLETLGRLAVALAAGGAFAFAAHRTRLLTPAAAVLAGAFGASIIGLGGAAWAVPALLFFGSSSCLSRLWDQDKPRPESLKATLKAESDSEPRNARQVLANGGVAWLLLAAALWAHAEALCFWGFVGAFAAAAADTWATEVGRRLGGAPLSLRTLRRVEAGRSGAVSGVGSLAALGGALLVSAGAGPFALPFLPAGTPVLAAVGIGTGAGLLGAFADSLGGAFLQARYRHARTGRLTEAPFTKAGHRNRRVQGVPLLTNEGINALCTAVGAAVAMAGVAAL